MGFTATVDANVAQAHEEAQSSSGFAPLPKGRYQFVIVPLDANKGLDFEIQPFAKSNAAYDGKMALRLRLQVVAESPTGRNRTFFVRIPLFSRYAGNQKNPQGAPARDYFSFWEKAIGIPTEAVLAGQLPGWEALANKRISAQVGDPILPDEYNPLGSNEVSFYGVAGDVAATPKLQPGTRVAPWIDEHGNLDPNGLPQFPGAQGVAPAGPTAPPAYGQPPAAPAYGAPPVTTAPAAPAAPAYGQPPAAPAGAPAYGAPPAATQGWGVTAEEAAQVAAQNSPALAAAAASQGSF